MHLVIRVHWFPIPPHRPKCVPCTVNPAFWDCTHGHGAQASDACGERGVGRLWLERLGSGGDLSVEPRLLRLSKIAKNCTCGQTKTTAVEQKHLQPNKKNKQTPATKRKRGHTKAHAAIRLDEIWTTFG